MKVNAKAENGTLVQISIHTFTFDDKTLRIKAIRYLTCFLPSR